MANTVSSVLTDLEVYCGDGNVDIQTESACQAAAADLDLTWNSAFAAVGDHRFCFWMSGSVYFNTVTQAEAKQVPRADAKSVCAANIDANIDCVGAWSACDASCEKTYSISTEQSGAGAACEASAGATDSSQCSPGDGACPAGR